MSLLSKKSWNPTSYKNKERVRRDEERFAKEVASKKSLSQKREAERRYEHLKRSKNGKCDKEIQLITDLEPPKNEKFGDTESKLGSKDTSTNTKFGESVEIPWYMKNDEQIEKEKRSNIMKLNLEANNKIKDDPQTIIERIGDLKSKESKNSKINFSQNQLKRGSHKSYLNNNNYNNDKYNNNNNDNNNNNNNNNNKVRVPNFNTKNLSDIEKLRIERLKREQVERIKKKELFREKGLVSNIPAEHIKEDIYKDRYSNSSQFRS